MDLIQVYFEDNEDLEKFRDLRSSKFYFGEYLPQGAKMLFLLCTEVYSRLAS